MKASQYILRTLKEVPADAVVASHVLMIRAGLIRREAAGLYDFLPLGLRSLRKIEAIVREEMERAGAVEFLLPILTSGDLWRQSERWDAMGPEMMRLRDRHKKDYCLGPTHEEAMTHLLSFLIKSYKDLPVNAWQMNTKFRDEIRPRFGLIRSREFIMKDAYSFHADETDLEREYQNMRATYRRIFERCGLTTVPVQADSGAMGGSASEEFMVPSEIGEETILTCADCGYAGNQEKVPARYPGLDKKDPLAVLPAKTSADPVDVHTPGAKTMEDLAKFFDQGPENFIKTVIYQTESQVALVFLRGDRDLNEVKLKNHLGSAELFPAGENKIRLVTGAEPGFAGPVNLPAGEGAGERVVLFDLSLATGGPGKEWISGANKTDYHLRGITLSRELVADGFVDLAAVEDGEHCPNCEKGSLKATRGIEVGHVFKLGDKYTNAFQFQVLDENGKAARPIMGTYGIGVNRTLQTLIEQNHDENGIIFPRSVAPYEIVLIPITKKEEELKQAEELYEKLRAAGLEVLLDDRDARPGFKFKDADLIGYPLRIVMGKGWFGGEGTLEMKARNQPEARDVKVADLEEAVSAAGQMLEEYEQAW